MPGRPWRPLATVETLHARVRLLRRVRRFFEARDVLEVSTPVLSAAGTVDPNIPGFEAVGGDPRWLHTSPEFPMKRLLAAGSGPIFQVCPVFRAGDRGRLHNPEFQMLEWYRPGFDHHDLMDELGELLAAVTTAADLTAAPVRLRYRDAFREHAGVDPFTDPVPRLRDAVAAAGVPAPPGLAGRDPWLDLLMGGVVGPRLGVGAPVLVYDYPASQAALARIRADDPPVAERFELYARGVELANGFHELTDAREQAHRFERERAAAGDAFPPIDRALLDALSAGLPDCAGVAMGLDRLLMLDLGLDSVADTMAFPDDRA